MNATFQHRILIAQTGTVEVMAYTIASIAAALTMAVMILLLGQYGREGSIFEVSRAVSMAVFLFPFVFVLASPIWLVAKIVLKNAANDKWWLFAMCGGFGGLAWDSINYETFPYTAVSPVSGVVGGLTYWRVRRWIGSGVTNLTEDVE
ncbi:MAG: hypothetical protein KKC72_19540 [Alphaproteobacteria bacterium]|nr:hypothetical protein [Alphaproteobacteria bacterium]MBU1836337.1 hypothetical protein [Alphaproteobacteria bacterium]